MRDRWKTWRTQILWLAMGCLVIAIAADPRGLQRYLRLKREAAQMAAENTNLAAANLRLTREVRALSNNPRYIQRAVREELGFVRRGEYMLELDSSSTALAWPDPGTASHP
jgi:cell division protein FtsB